MTPHEIDLDRVAQACYSAVISDICDHQGRRKTSGPSRIRRLTSGPDVLVGWARTVVSSPVAEPPERHYGNEIDFIDSLSPGEVVVAKVEDDAAFWGELFSTAAQARGARGAIIDGPIRDLQRVEPLGFGIWATGTVPTDSLGRLSISSVDREIRLGHATVSTGDLVVADVDGVTFVPGDMAAEVVTAAIQKATTESLAKDLLRAGSTLAQAWERYRVL